MWSGGAATSDGAAGRLRTRRSGGAQTSGILLAWPGYGACRAWVRPPPVDVTLADLLTIGLLVLLEGLLSADNALVLAILVLSLPRDQQRKALRYGILGAFLFRGLATIFAAYMIQLSWMKLIGAVYLLWLPWAHFRGGDSDQRRELGLPVAAGVRGAGPFRRDAFERQPSRRLA